MTGCQWGASAFPDREPGVSRFNYSLLTGPQRAAYESLEDAVLDGRSRAVLKAAVPAADIDAATGALVLDNPLLLGLEHMSARFDGDSVEMTPRMRLSPLGRARELRSVERCLSEIADAVDGRTGFEMECAVHDWFLSSVTYSKDERRDFDMSGPLVHGAGSCQGISLAVSYVLNRLGMDTGVIGGWESEGWVRHAWNVVSLESGDYHLDVTHDITWRNHGMFNVDDSVALRSRRHRTRGVVCDSTLWNYHRMTGMSVGGRGEALRVAEVSLRKRRGSAEVRYTPAMDGDAVADAFLETATAMGVGIRLSWSDDAVACCCSLSMEYLRRRHFQIPRGRFHMQEHIRKVAYGEVSLSCYDGPS